MPEIPTYQTFVGLFTLGLNVYAQSIGPGMVTTILYRRLRLNNSTTLKSSLFAKYDKVSADIPQTLELFPHRMFKDCESHLECAFLCQGEKSCEFFHYDVSTKGCVALDTSLADVRDDGIYTCPLPFSTYGDASLTFCLKTINSFKTKANASTSCANIGGRVAVLIEDQKHTQAAALAQAIYNASRTAVWIDATMNTGEKKWYWSDGTRVPESRFQQVMSAFYHKPTSKACVSFIGNRYYMMDCTKLAYVMCDTTGLNKL